MVDLKKEDSFFSIIVQRYFLLSSLLFSCNSILPVYPSILGVFQELLSLFDLKKIFHLLLSISQFLDLWLHHFSRFL